MQAAIDAHRVLYFPSGTYRITNTLRLRPDSVLIGFNPVTTVIMATDEAPNFTGEGDAVPLVESAKGGAAIMTGIGIRHSPIWISGRQDWYGAQGPRSMVEDVNFTRGPGRRNSALDSKSAQACATAQPPPNRS